MKQLFSIYITFLFLTTQFITAQNFDFTADKNVDCENLDVQFSIVNLTGVTTAEWDFGNGITHTGTSPGVISYTDTGVYNVTLIINNTDTVFKPDYIGVFPTPDADFEVNDSILPGSYSVAFFPSPPPSTFDTVTYIYNWNFGDGNTFETRNNEQGHRYSEPGTYYVTLNVNDLHGCDNSSLDTVIIQDRINASNIFTPNNDNINDEFIIQTNGYTIYSLTIFTRNGTMVYKTESALLKWDGRDNSGVEMSPGIYYYVVKEINGSFSEPGFFYLVK